MLLGMYVQVCLRWGEEMFWASARHVKYFPIHTGITPSKEARETAAATYVEIEMPMASSVASPKAWA